MANNKRAFELTIANVQKAKDVAALYSWTARTSSGAYLCVPCSAHAHMCRGQGVCLDLIPWLAQNGGLEYESRQKFQKKARVHDQSKLHETCMELFHESVASPLASAVARPIVLEWLRDGKHRKAEQENGDGSRVLQQLYEEKPVMFSQG